MAVCEICGISDDLTVNPNWPAACGECAPFVKLVANEMPNMVQYRGDFIALVRLRKEHGEVGQGEPLSE